jgi:hypothetical protein
MYVCNHIDIIKIIKSSAYYEKVKCELKAGEIAEVVNYRSSSYSLHVKHFIFNLNYQIDKRFNEVAISTLHARFKWNFYALNFNFKSDDFSFASHTFYRWVSERNEPFGDHENVHFNGFLMFLTHSLSTHAGWLRIELQFRFFHFKIAI